MGHGDGQNIETDVGASPSLAPVAARAQITVAPTATALHELFLSVSAGVHHALSRRWVLEITLTGGYNLLAGEAVWQQMADASPELHYWPADVYFGLNAGVRVTLWGTDERTAAALRFEAAG